MYVCEGADVAVCTGIQGRLDQHHVHRPWCRRCRSTGQTPLHRC